MNSRTKRKLRQLADPNNKLTRAGLAKIDSLKETAKGKLVRKNQANYFAKLIKKGVDNFES